MKTNVVGLFALVALAVACGSGDSEGTGGDSPSGTSGSAGKKCYSVAVNDTDGSSACSDTVCPGGEYCTGGAFCSPGCASTANCSQGQHCDFSADPDVGICRVPASSLEVECAGGSTSSGSGNSCVDRCVAKATSCAFPASEGAAQCQSLCGTITEEQIACLEDSTCAEVEGLGEGMPVCGIGS